MSLLQKIGSFLLFGKRLTEMCKNKTNKSAFFINLTNSALYSMKGGGREKGVGLTEQMLTSAGKSRVLNNVPSYTGVFKTSHFTRSELQPRHGKEKSLRWRVSSESQKAELCQTEPSSGDKTLAFQGFLFNAAWNTGTLFSVDWVRGRV